MKTRSSVALNAKRAGNEGRNVRHKQIQYSGPSFSHLPNSILENIFLRLSIKRIIVCKCVCKTWHNLISDPEFAKIHFDQAQVYPLLRSSGVTFLSRILYLVQPEIEDFERKLDMCEHSYPKTKCFCDVKVKLDTKLKLPLRKLHTILDDNNDDHSMLNPGSGGERDKYLKLKMKEHKYGIINSCKGLLCLCHPMNNDPVIVCNPVTGEFINLPEANRLDYLFASYIECGFGFSPITNQYKVIRMYSHLIQNNNGFRYFKEVTEVHIIGSKSWKTIDIFPDSYMAFPTNLNGCIYWFSGDFLTYFDIEKECFGSISQPAQNDNQYSNVSMGVLREELYISHAHANVINFWVMKDRGANKVWYKVFAINMCTRCQSWPVCRFQPIKYMNNGALLMFHSCTDTLVYKDPRKLGFKFMKVRGMQCQLEAIPHIPSFLSLKDILSGDNVQVLNVKSRCAELKLYKESKSVSLVDSAIL